MFECGYPFQLVTRNTKELEPNLVCKHLYRFKNKDGVAYLAPVYEYRHKVFALKFHLRAHKKYKHRYNLVVNQDLPKFDAGRVLRTMVDIATSILAKEPLASFAFIGVFKVRSFNGVAHKNSEEAKELIETQRYRVYKRIVERFLGNITFIHNYQAKSNAYLLVNRNNPNVMELNTEIMEMFLNDFQDLGDLQ